MFPFQKITLKAHIYVKPLYCHHDIKQILPRLTAALSFVQPSSFPLTFSNPFFHHVQPQKTTHSGKKGGGLVLAEGARLNVSSGMVCGRVWMWYCCCSSLGVSTHLILSRFLSRPVKDNSKENKEKDFEISLRNLATVTS